MNRKEENSTRHNTSSNYPFDKLVLRTNIHKPPVREEFIERQSLIEQLEANVNLPLTLVSAATGCGKSVTTSQWLEHTQYRYGWLTLDKEHNEVNVFLNYLVSILKTQWPRRTFGLESLLGSVNLPPHLISHTLINDLDQLKELFVLVLDDYHMIREEKIHDIIDGVLRHPSDNFHLVILTQQDPSLKLAKMRAQLRLHEVRMRDLALTKEEAIDLSNTFGAEITNEQINELVKQTDGWITGITAGLMVLKEGVDFGKVIKSLGSRNSVISELLDEVVLSGMSVAMQKFLELTALTDRFSIELIDAMVTAIDDDELTQLKSKEFLGLSKSRNLFLIPLDTIGQWYKYHRFFRNQIQNRVGKHLTNDMVLKLYKAASLWFDGENYIEEALKYAILSQDMTFAVSLFDKIRNELFNAEQFQRLDRLIDQFPSEVRNSYLELSISLAMLQDHKGNFSAMEKYLSQARRLFEDYSKQTQNARIKKLKGEFHSTSTFLPYILGNFDQCIIEAQECLKLLPANEPNYFREFALAYYVFAKQAQGNAKEGISFLEENLESLSVADKYFRGRLLFLKSMVYEMEADTNEMYKSATQLNALVEPNAFPGEWMAGIYYLAISSYLKNELEDVDRFHQKLWEYRYAGRPFWVIHNLIIMGLSFFAQGKWDKLSSLINECLELTSDLEIQALKGMVHAFEVEIALRRNDLDQAIEVSALANFEPHPPIFYYYYPQLTRVKLFLRTEEKEKGIELLNELLDFGRKRNNVNLIIQALVLKATIQAKEANNEHAKSTLCKALFLSKNKGLLRSFLDYGDPIYQLLREIAEEQPENNHIRKILQGFRKDPFFTLNKMQQPTANKAQFVNALSNRELQVLNLVAQGFKNDEIAEKLFVSLDTIKKHLYNAYQKLYVNNRISAVKKVQQLGLMDEE